MHGSKLWMGLCLAEVLLGQGNAPAPARSRILGVAHYSIFVSDLAKARAFYEDFLGFAEPFTLPNPDGSVHIAFVKINDTQSIELFNEAPKSDGRLNHIGLYTDSAERMRAYLASRGVAVPAQISVSRTGNKKISVVDPDGHGVEIVEYQPQSWTGLDTGKHMPTTRISARIMHVGILVGSLDRAVAFYLDTLGFQERWRGASATSTTLSWVHTRAPEGEDGVEFMLYKDLPPADKRGTAHHICLMVPDIQKAVETLEARPARQGYAREIKIATGIDHRRQANLYDPDGTRVELMEANTIDGKPVPSSTLPPPH